MRRNGMALTALLLASLPAFAQPPRTPPAAPPAAANATLDRYLQRWEEEMRKVQTLAAQINRLDRDKSFETTTRFSGYAQYMKVPSPGGGAPLNLAMLELRLDGKELAEKFVCTGTYLYHFVPAQKEVRAYEMPKPKPGPKPGQVADDSIMSFLFGMKASEARRRYELKLFKEDTWYIYVDITPRSPEDRRDFQRARVVLNKGTFMPRQLWFEHPNGNEVTWDIPTIRSGVELKRANFDKPEVPPGWKLVPVSRTGPERGTPPPAPPRVIRPNR